MHTIWSVEGEKGEKEEGEGKGREEREGGRGGVQ